MADPIRCMVRLIQYEEAGKRDPKFLDDLPALEHAIVEGLKRRGFRDVQAARDSLQFAVARIVAAERNAEEQLTRLVIAEDEALEGA